MLRYYSFYDEPECVKPQLLKDEETPSDKKNRVEYFIINGPYKTKRCVYTDLSPESFIEQMNYAIDLANQMRHCNNNIRYELATDSI